MASAEELVIMARLVDDVSEQAARIAATTGALKGTLSDLSLSGGKAGKSMSDLTRAHNTLEQAGKSLDSRLQSLSGTLEHRLMSGLRLAKTGVELLTGALAGLGVNATLQFEAASTKMMTFAGVGQSVADQMTRQLRTLSNPASLGSETQAFGALTANRVMTNAQAMAFMPRLNDIAAASDDPNSSLGTIAQAVNRIQQNGTLNVRSLRSIFGQNVNVSGLLQSIMPGMSIAAIQQALQSPDKYVAAAPFLKALQDPNNPALANFTGARSRYLATPAGAGREALKDVNATVTDVLNPIMTRTVGPWLAGLSTALADPKTQQKLQGFLSGGIDQVGKALKQAAEAARPLLPALESMVKALPALAAAAIRVGGVVLGVVGVFAPLVSGFGWLIAHVPAVADGLALLAGALLAYKAVTTITGYVTGFLDTLKAFQTVSSAEGFGSGLKALFGVGQKSTLELAAATMETAADTMLAAAEKMAVGAGIGPGAAAGASTAAAAATAGGAATTAGIGDAAASSLGLGALGPATIVPVAGMAIAAGAGLYKGATAKTAPKPNKMTGGGQYGFGLEDIGRGAHNLWDDIFGGGGHKSKDKTPAGWEPSGSPTTTIVVPITQHFYGPADANAVRGAASQGTQDGINASTRSKTNRGSRTQYSPAGG